MLAADSAENFLNTLDVNVVAVASCSSEASRLMVKHKIQGHIINFNSIAGHKGRRILKPMSIYNASKFAITGLTETLRMELALAKTNIKITVNRNQYNCYLNKKGDKSNFKIIIQIYAIV